MPDYPLVSICIPTRNDGPALRRAVDSALAQTGVEVEVIVVDDCSTDGSAAALHCLDPRLTVLRQELRGSNPALNRALAAARGEWVQFLDTDDYLLPDKIATQLASQPADAPVNVIYSPVIIEEVESRGEVDGRKSKVECPYSPFDPRLPLDPSPSTA